MCNTPFLLARSDLRYVFVSEALAKMLGHRPEELGGKKIAEVIGERAFQTILPHVNAVLAGQRVEYEMEVHYKDISPRFVHVTYTPDDDGSGHVFARVASECGRDGATVDRCLHQQILDAAIIITGAQKGNIQLADSSSGLLQIAAQPNDCPARGKMRFDWRAKGLVCEITLQTGVG